MKREVRDQIKQWRVAWNMCLKGWCLTNAGKQELGEKTFQEWYVEKGFGGKPAEIEAAIKYCASLGESGFYHLITHLEDHETCPLEKESGEG